MSLVTSSLNLCYEFHGMDYLLNILNIQINIDSIILFHSIRNYSMHSMNAIHVHIFLEILVVFHFKSKNNNYEAQT